MIDQLINHSAPVMGFLPLLPLLGVILGTGVVATGAVVANNLSDAPEVVNNVQGDQTQSNSFAASMLKWLPWAAIAGGAYYLWSKRKK